MGGAFANRAGEVELGCNVHDWMLGYIYVVNTPFFARTNEAGRAEINAPDGAYTLRWWHPRIQDTDEQRSLPVEAGDQALRAVLSRPLLPHYEQETFNGLGDYD